MGQGQGPCGLEIQELICSMTDPPGFHQKEGIDGYQDLDTSERLSDFFEDFPYSVKATFLTQGCLSAIL